MVDLAIIAKVQRSQKARASQGAGADAEAIVRNRLIASGFKHVCRIETGFAKIRGKWTRVRKVAGDIRCVGEDGRSVLVEVKWRPERLVFSDLENHQIDALNEHQYVGGMSLLAWCHRGGAELLYWSELLLMGFGPGSYITPILVATARVEQ